MSEWAPPPNEDELARALDREKYAILAAIDKQREKCKTEQLLHYVHTGEVKPWLCTLELPTTSECQPYDGRVYSPYVLERFQKNPSFTVEKYAYRIDDHESRPGTCRGFKMTIDNKY